MKTSEIIQKTLDVLEQGWCQTVVARNPQGKTVHPNQFDACSWCIIGAFKKVMNETMSHSTEIDRAKYHANQAVTEFTGNKFISLSDFNDAKARTFDDVMAVMLHAKAMALEAEL